MIDRQWWGSMMADKEAERIRYETGVLKATVLVTAATTGGSIRVLLGEHTFLRLGLVGVGLLVTLVLVIGIWRLDRWIRALIKKSRSGYEPYRLDCTRNGYDHARCGRRLVLAVNFTFVMTSTLASWTCLRYAILGESKERYF
jgi:hypothetical protein